MDNIREILANAIWAHTNMDIKINSQDVVKKIVEKLQERNEDIQSANKTDVENVNGFKLDMSIFNQICNNLVLIKDSYRSVVSVNTCKNNYLEGEQTDKVGTICLVYDGNTYCLLETVIKSILTHNALILTTKTNYMKETNELIISIVKDVLESYQIDRNLVQSLCTNDIEKLLSNSASINKVIAIGNKDFQEEIKRLSKIEVITKGYNSYEIYIEDLRHLDVIQEIAKEGKDVQIYIKKGLRVPFDNYIEVANMKEVIGIINFTTCGYSSAIFTDNAKNASKFLREVKTKNLSVNTNPLLKNTLDIDINSFLNMKHMKYPIPLADRVEAVEFNFKQSEKYKEEKKMLEDKMAIEETQLELKEKDEQIKDLRRQLQQSHSLVRKYMEIFTKSFIVRFFGKLKKSDVINDIKLLS